MLRAAWLLLGASLLPAQPMDFTGEVFYFRSPLLFSGTPEYRWTPTGIIRAPFAVEPGLYPATSWTNNGEYACGREIASVTAVHLPTGRTYNLPDASDCLAIFPGPRALVRLFRGGEFTWQWAFWHFTASRLELLPIGRELVRSLETASYDGTLLFTTLPGAQAPLTVHSLPEGREETLGIGLQLLSVTADGSRYTARRFAGGPSYVMGWTREPQRILTLDRPALLSPAGNALFWQDTDGGWWRQDFVTGEVSQIVAPMPDFAPECSLLAPGGACFLTGPVRPDIRVSLRGIPLPVEVVPGLGGVVRLPADLPLGEATAVLSTAVNPITISRQVRVVAAAPRLHPPATAIQASASDRLTLTLSGWNGRQPACFAYPYSGQVLGPVERLTIDQWTDQDGLLRATFRLPALDFGAWNELAPNQPHTAEIDCGYQPLVGSQRFSLTVR